jgi:succinate dehydrogenase / fumarate reductase iron-sulfur subunit
MADTSSKPDFFEVRVLRQDGPQTSSYWERHRVRYERDMNVISVLQRIASQAKTVDGKEVSPVVWECNCLEEVCGACTMIVNGRVRQACTALVDRLMEDRDTDIELQPMSKFPVQRDLIVERRRMFRALEKSKAWVTVDTYEPMGAGPRVLQSEQEASYPLSQCMSCGCCLEACPQYTKVELAQRDSESDESFAERQDATFDDEFVGAHAISQVMLFNAHPTAKSDANERLDSLMAPGGIQVCGNAQNCVAVCPKEIPLTTSIARAGRATTVRAIKKFFG